MKVSLEWDAFFSLKNTLLNRESAMKQLILLILFCGLFASTTIGQRSDREIYPRQTSINHNDAVKDFSRDYVTALLNTSSLFDLQQSKSSVDNLAIVNIKGLENTTLLVQSGYGITGIIDIDGSYNETRLHQKGADLLSILNIEGNSNQFNMNQQGNSLQSYFQVSGSVLDLDVLQTNEGMRLTQSGAGAIPLSIQQTGTPTPIIINNN